MSKTESPAITQAKSVIAGVAIEPQALLDLVNQLKKQRAFGLARRMLEKFHSDTCNKRLPSLDEKLKRKLTQAWSLCTYKDPDLNPSEKLDRALEILKGLDNLDLTSPDCTKDQETLGLTGAIYKRQWELCNHTAFLETSLAYYAHGYAQGIEKDHGYTGINTAFVLDLLAGMETNKSACKEKTDQASAIREELIKTLTKMGNEPDNAWLKKTWWFNITVAEAYFGLKNYKEAKTWLLQTAAVPDVPEWEWETSVRQLARLLQLREKDGSYDEAHKVFRAFLGEERVAGLDALLKGKMGLALSGGGFRASLFHIGLLAKLAELDLLRNIEYVSCVSGGSIIGAHYYLEVRNLLQTKPDQDITRQDYIDIVKKVEKEFLKGVQTNIRVQVLSSLTANLKMLLPSYSRTNRLGELYEEKIFSRTATGSHGEKKLFLDELTIKPAGTEGYFSPKDQNWRRAAKVPILVLNATPLNTGHNWQFTTTWMGEPPSSVGAAIDGNYRLRRMYYKDAPAPHNKMRLGDAVAASSCVPGLFKPLALSGLYKDKIVQLVDGGVHDNQGTAALLEQGCTVLFVSDASGQMDAQDKPGAGPLSVPLRANSILMARLRESQYRELDARRRSGLLQGFMFIHLKQGLESQPVDWIDCQDPSDQPSPPPMLPYGVQREVQKKLAAIRTDLDSFSDTEAFALMSSAYKMAGYALKNTSETLGFKTSEVINNTWAFLGIEPEMLRGGSNTPLLKQLSTADKLFLKIWHLSPKLKFIGGLGLVFSLAFISISIWPGLLSLSWGHAASALLILTVILSTGLIIPPVFAKLHLKFFDKKFLEQGRLNTIQDQDPL